MMKLGCLFHFIYEPPPVLMYRSGFRAIHKPEKHISYSLYTVGGTIMTKGIKRFSLLLALILLLGALPAFAAT